MDTPQPPTSLAIPTRQDVRALVARQHADLTAVVAAGGNPHQRGLEHSDAVTALAAALEHAHGNGVGAEFVRLWAEESSALTQQSHDERMATLHRAESEALGANRTAQGLVAVVSLLALLYILFG